MENVDAIAVEVDDIDLLEAILLKATYNFDFKKTTSINSEYLVFGEGKQIWSGDKTDLKGVDNLGKLSKNWNKVVEFLEQEDETFEINGHEVEIGDPEFSIGCYEATQETLRRFVKDSELLDLSDDSVLKVQGEEVTLKQAKDLLNYLEDQN